jgi:hypothetical protein
VRLRDNLLAESHEDSFARSLFTSLLREERDFEKNVKVVSSANNIGRVLERALGRSLIYIRNRMGPRIDP